MAVELVGGALLSAFLQVTFEKLASADIREYFRARKLNEKLLKKLNITLLSINAVVDDAELKQIRNQSVKAWLDAVKDAVLEAEEIYWKKLTLKFSDASWKLNLSPVLLLLTRYGGVSSMLLPVLLTKKLNQRCMMFLTI
jgi:hypothetical protein